MTPLLISIIAAMAIGRRPRPPFERKWEGATQAPAVELAGWYVVVQDGAWDESGGTLAYWMEHGSGAVADGEVIWSRVPVMGISWKDDRLAAVVSRLLQRYEEAAWVFVLTMPYRRDPRYEPVEGWMVVVTDERFAVLGEEHGPVDVLPASFPVELARREARLGMAYEGEVVLLLPTGVDEAFFLAVQEIGSRRFSFEELYERMGERSDEVLDQAFSRAGFDVSGEHVRLPDGGYLDDDSAVDLEVLDVSTGLLGLMGPVRTFEVRFRVPEASVYRMPQLEGSG